LCRRAVGPAPVGRARLFAAVDVHDAAAAEVDEVVDGLPDALRVGGVDAVDVRARQPAARPGDGRAVGRAATSVVRRSGE
jgi:hypothetical protein